MRLKITIRQFEKILPSICDAKTAYNPREWTPSNPLKGHCAVVALAAQNIFGGELEMGVTAIGESHYWNRLPDGTKKDFTAPQFEHDSFPEFFRIRFRSRDYVLIDPNTGKPRQIAKRYNLFWSRLMKKLSGKKIQTFEKRKIFFSKIPGRYAGWRPGKIFGRLDCRSGMRMKKENRVFFLTWEDAICQGYRPCKMPARPR